MTATELTLANILQQQSAATLLIADLTDRVTTQSAETSRIRAALRSAVQLSAPSYEADANTCSGASCNPSLKADAADVTMHAPLGRIRLRSSECGIDDLCDVTAFSWNLREVLRDV